jgi:hypothetical protein
MKNKTESGQAIVLLVFAVIALMGFTALAIDGGMVYSDRRHAQSASDAASLAGGGFVALALDNYEIYFRNFNCSLGDISTIMGQAMTVANNRAISNDYTNAEVSVTAVCVDNGTPPDRKYIDVATHIVRKTNTSLIHFVYQGDVVNEVESRVRVHPRTPFAEGNSVVSLNDGDCSGHTNGATFHGNADVNVHGGGVWSNGCLRGSGGPEVTVDGGGNVFVSEIIGDAVFTPPPTQAGGTLDPDSYDMDEYPDCTDGDAHNVNASAINGDFGPGLYCITGDVKINASDVISGTEVTLYLLDGGMTINGNATVQLTAPPQEPDPDPALPGMLILTAPGNSSDIQLNGNSDSYFMGIILAPESNIDMLGTENITAYYTQVIGWNVEVGGTADTNVWYFENQAFENPPNLDMQK